VNSIPTQSLEPGSFGEMLRHQVLREGAAEPAEPIRTEPRSGRTTSNPPRADYARRGWDTAPCSWRSTGARILLDPIWSDRCSPVSFAGPRRFFAPPLPLDELPPIDAVLVSHDHYDHLDMPTVKALAARGTRFVVPLGIGAHLARWGVAPDHITDLDWYEDAPSPMRSASRRHRPATTPGEACGRIRHCGRRG
jgi:hypothetical protein